MGAHNTARQTIWEDGDVTEMARITVDGDNAIQSDLASITRKIFDLADITTAIAEDSILVSSTIFDTLQNDSGWTKDETGFNFKDRIGGSNFSTGGSTYRVEYYFVGSSSEKFWVVYVHPARKVFSS